jgi:archaeal flagellin N-terminal-like domain
MSDIKAFLFNDDRGVSPVIGVILMVATTVILAAVIAAFVFGVGATNSSAPTVTWDYDYNESNGDLTIIHAGGDTLDPDRIDLLFTNVDGVPSPIGLDGKDNGGKIVSGLSKISDPMQAGNSVRVDLTDDNGGGADSPEDTTEFELDITFTSKGGTTTIIGETSGPDA